VLKNISLILVSTSVLIYAYRADQTLIVPRREDRDLWPNRGGKVICKICCAYIKVPITKRSFTAATRAIPYT